MRPKTRFSPPKTKLVTLADGLRWLRDEELITGKLYDWADLLRLTRNDSAHGGKPKQSRQDAEDIYTFGVAIIECIYDLDAKYRSFK